MQILTLLGSCLRRLFSMTKPVISGYCLGTPARAGHSDIHAGLDHFMILT